MKIGIVTDIHANSHSLKVVLDFLKEKGVDEMLCLGDVVGYGSDPLTCCDLIREHCAVTVCGNHDAAVTRRMDYSFYREEAQHALDWTREQLREDQLEWLSKLPFTATYKGLTLCHGTPLSPENFNYLFGEDQARTLLPDFNELAEITLAGHTHWQKLFALTPHEAVEIAPRRMGFRRGNKYVITVGSVGQPRDHDPRCACAIYETEEPWMDFFRLDYDFSGAAQAIFEAGLDATFGKRLFLGV